MGCARDFFGLPVSKFPCRRQHNPTVSECLCPSMDENETIFAYVSKGFFIVRAVHLRKQNVFDFYTCII